MTTEELIPIQFVVDTFNQGRIRNTNRTSRRCDCPLCNGNNTFSYDLKGNYWHCFKCNEKGNSVTLYAKLNGLTYKNARSKLLKLINNGDIDKERYKKPEDTGEIEIVPMNFLYRDIVYRNYLKQLGLNKKHKQDLLRRGLNEEEIKKFGYKTFDSNEYIAKKAVEPVIDKILAKINDGEKEVGIPGFYDLDKVPSITNTREGYLVPVRDIEGYISGFQIRYDNPINSNKYGWLSSGYTKSGVSFDGKYCCNIQHSGNWKECWGDGHFPETIALTEGALKADIATTLYDHLDPNNPHLFLGLTGVGNVSQLKKELNLIKSTVNGETLKKIDIFVDMDYLENKNVEKAMNNIVKIIQDCGLEYELKQWNPKYKGIDDMLLATLQNKKVSS